MKIKEIRHELLYDRDNIIISVEKSERQQIIAWLEGIRIYDDADYDISIKKHREKRHLTQNSYYWLLLHKMLSVLGTHSRDINVLHNEQINKYGVPETDSNGNLIYCLYKASIDFLPEESIHLKPTGKTEDRNGQLYAWYMMMKPTHDYNTKEFSDLIDGTVKDAKELGIETLSDDELARLKTVTGE